MSATVPSASTSGFGANSKITIKCSECPQIFAQRKHLYAHLRKIHDKEPDIKRPTSTLKCNKCEKLFSSNLTLKRHIGKFHASFEIQDHNYHQESQALKCSKLYCPSAGCLTKCISYEKLRAHLQSKHNFTTEVDTFEFNSLQGKLKEKDCEMKKSNTPIAIYF